MGNQLVYSALAELADSNATAALCSVIRTQGSVPRQVGAKMLVYEDGRTVGTVGGGELEARVIARAVALLQERPAGSPVPLCEVVNIPLVDPSKGDAGVCGGEMDVFVETILAEPTVLVVGCGHVGKEVAALAKWLGFRVAVTDDRVELCNETMIPDADVYLPGLIPAALDGFEITDQTFIAAVTRGVKADADALPSLLQSKAPYVGVIGSRRRWTVAIQELRECGVPDEVIRRVHAPIGLEIGADTPREIALSIMAEILAVRKGIDVRAKQWFPPELA